MKLQDLPCGGGGGPFCTRAHLSWSSFDQDVDDVVPLANKPWGQPVSKGQDQEEEEMGPRVAKIWRHPMLSYHSGSPMERVHLDFIGPLPRTERGNEHILMMVDQFTKWVECIPLPSQSAEETTRAAGNQFFSRFGCPFQVFTDQGRTFESSLFREMCELLHIHKSRTTPYRPSANGQVERCNRTLMAAVRCFIGKNQRSWDQYLSQLAGALRSSVNRSTGYTPNMMMLGREIGLPAELMFGSPGNTGQPEGDHYVGELQTSIEGVHRVARETLKQSQKRMKRDYDVKVTVRELKLGDLVYQLDTATVKGKTRKLSPSWKGPGVVIEKLTPYLYKIKLKRGIITANHDRLKLCQDREVPEWAQKLSQQIIKGTGYTKEKGGVKDQRGIEISFIVFVGSHILGSS